MPRVWYKPQRSEGLLWWKKNIETKEASIDETLLLTPPPSKIRTEMPKGEFETLLRFEASRREERGDVINKNGIGRNELLKMINLRKGKRRRRWLCPGKPLRVYSHSRRRTYHVCFQNIRKTTHRKKQKRRHCMPSTSYFNVRGTYTGEDIQN